MSEQARKSDLAILFECEPTTLWIAENAFIRLPLKPVLTFPPAGTKVFGDDKFLLKPTGPDDPNVVVADMTIEGGS